jgi:DNA-binding IclR family transcriptional regulator
LLERALDMITDLAAITGTTVRVGMLDGHRLAVATTGGGQSSADGFVDDLTLPHASALGRVLLAFSPADVVDEVVAAARVAAGSASFSAERLRRLLATTRLTRIAVHRDESGGPCQVAVPVFGTGGSLLAALEASAPDLKSGLEQIRGALLVAAASLSRQLATSPPPDEPGVDGARAPGDTGHPPFRSSVISSGASPVEYHS